MATAVDSRLLGNDHREGGNDGHAGSIAAHYLLKMYMSGDWKRQQEVLIQEFLDGWSWEQVVSSWLSRISESPVSLEPLFTRIEIHDPAAPEGREHELSWWPASSVPEMYLRLQDHLNKHPGTVGPVHPDSFHTRRGELETIRVLWEGQGNSLKYAGLNGVEVKVIGTNHETF